MAAYVTLCQGLARNTLLAAIEAEARELKRACERRRNRRRGLDRCLAGCATGLEAIRPDALGEAVVLQAFGHRQIDGPGVVKRAFEQSGLRWRHS